MKNQLSILFFLEPNFTITNPLIDSGDQALLGFGFSNFLSLALSWQVPRKKYELFRLHPFI